MANSQRRIIIFVFLILLTLSSFHFSNVEGETHVPTTNPSKSSNIQQLVAKIRTTAPAFKSVLGVQPNDASPECNIVVGLPDGYSCENVMIALGLSEDYFNSINPNIDCNALFTGQWICVVGTA